MTQTQERVEDAQTREAPAGDDTGAPSPYESRFLLASAAVSAQSHALLAVPSHAQSTQPAGTESSSNKRDAKVRDPIADAGWLAAADALLMGGLLGDW